MPSSTLNLGRGSVISVCLDQIRRGRGSRNSPTGGNPESWGPTNQNNLLPLMYKIDLFFKISHPEHRVCCYRCWEHSHSSHTLPKCVSQVWESKVVCSAYRDAEVNPIVSVNFLSNPADGRVLEEFVALPLQAESSLGVRPAVWIHAITANTHTGSEDDQPETLMWQCVRTVKLSELIKSIKCIKSSSDVLEDSVLLALSVLHLYIKKVVRWSFGLS